MRHGHGHNNNRRSRHRHGGGSNNGGSNSGSSNNRRNNSSGNGQQFSRSHIFDSNGPDVRIRGTAFQVCDKYMALAKDAASSGDLIMAENYLQHAEHYQRIVSSFVENNWTSPSDAAAMSAQPVSSQSASSQAVASDRRFTPSPADADQEQRNSRDSAADMDLGLPETLLRKPVLASSTKENQSA